MLVGGTDILGIYCGAGISASVAKQVSTVLLYLRIYNNRKYNTTFHVQQ